MVDFLQYITEGSLDMVYGGVPEGGGYGSSTEFEVGLQRYCEAAHCILGSLVKSGRSNYFWVERGHIEEEVGIIENDKYAIRTLVSLEENGPRLGRLVRKLKGMIGNGVRFDIRLVAGLAYDCIGHIAYVSTPVHGVIRNPFMDIRCDWLTMELVGAIKKLDWGDR